MLTITSPINNQNFTEGDNISFVFAADGSVTEVDLYKDGVLIATLLPPFSHTWFNVAASLDNDSIIHYRFDGTVVDYSPSERDPIIINKHNANYVTGIKGSGGISLGNFVNSTERSYILIPSTPLMRSVATELTIMYWFKGSPSLNHSIFCTAAPENKGIHIVTLAGDGRTDFYINQNEVGNAYRLRSSPTTAGELIDENVWKHFAWTYDGNVIRCYINGVLSNSRTVGAINFGSDADWLINSNEAESRGDGEYDDFRIYGYAVSESKVVEVYNDNPSDTVVLTAKGNTGAGWVDSDPVNIVISKPNRPPVIKVISPRNTAVFEAGEGVPIQFLCGDPDGDVEEVSITANNQTLGVISSEPWEFVWLDPTIGEYELLVSAEDNDGLDGFSPVLDISVTPKDLTPRIIKQNQVATIVTGADIDLEDDPDRPRYALDDAARAKQVAVGKEEEHIRPDSSIVRVPGRISERFEVDIYHPRPYVSGDSLTFRSELYTKYNRISNMREGWFSVSFYWDANQVPDKDDETVYQWHVVPLYSTPFFSAAVRNGNLNWQVRWEVSGFANTMQFNMGPHRINQWDDYIFYIKLSETGEGRFKLWRNRRLARTYHPYTGDLWKVPTAWTSADAENFPLSHVATPDKGILPTTVVDGGVECSVVDWFGKTCYVLPAVVEINRKWGLYKHGWNYVDPEDPLNSGTDTINRVLRIANMKFTNANAPSAEIFPLLDADGLNALEGIEEDTKYQLTIQVTPIGGGTVNITSGNYTEGQQVPLVATNNTGYTFLNWQRNGVVLSTNPSYTHSKTASNETITAHFVLAKHQLTVTAGTGGTATGGGSFAQGETTSLVATVSSGYQFDGWYRDNVKLSGDNPYIYTARNQADTVQARFLRKSVAVISADPESGTKPLTVQFSSSGSVADSYAWDFGNGSTSFLALPYTIYQDAGTYTVTLTTTYGELTDTDEIEITVTDPVYVPPTVKITSPQNLSANFEAPAKLPFRVLANSELGISKVEYWVDGVLIATVTNSPYSYDWNNVDEGAYTIVAKAFDAEGSTESDPVSVTVYAPSEKYKLNGKELSDFGIIAGRSPNSNISISGHLDFPKRLGKSFHVWDDEEGVEPYVSYDEIKFEGRDIKFHGYVEGTDKNDVMRKLYAFYDYLNTLNGEVLFSTKWGSWLVIIQSEVEATQIKAGMVSIVVTFRQTDTGIQPIQSGGTADRGIDGINFGDLGFTYMNLKNQWYRPTTKDHHAIGYYTEPFQVTKAGAREMVLSGLFETETYQEMVSIVSSLYSLFAKEGVRTLQINNEPFREFFVKDGFQVTNIIIKHQKCRALLSINMMELNKPVFDPDFFTDTDGNYILSNTNQKIIIRK